MAESFSKSRTKTILKLALLGLAALGVVLVSQSVDAATSSSNPRELFTEAIPERSELVDDVEWLPDAAGLVREVDVVTRELITDAWIGAFEAVGTTGPESRIVAETYLSGNAELGVDRGEQRNEFSQLSHKLRLEFISADGQVAAISAPESKSIATYMAGEHVAVAEVTESYEAVILLEDGNWRINQIVRRTSDIEWLDS